jgi:mannose-6-phosphate isomerase class I
MPASIAATDHDAWWHPGACVAGDLADGWKRLVECRYFATDSRKLTGKCRYQPDPSRFELLICLEGAGHLNAQELAAGDVWLLPAGSTPIEIATDTALSLLRTYESSANP